MSSSKLSSKALDQLYEEVISHMKSNGTYDEIRMRLIDPIWTDPQFKNIIERFEIECEQFCDKNVDLSKNRNTLRSQMASHFDTHSHSARLVKNHINRMLKERDDELKSRYYENAEKFLQKFLPQEAQPIIEQINTDMDMDIDSSSSSSSVAASPTRSAESPYQPEISVAEEDGDEDIQRPPFSPIGNHSDEHDMSALVSQQPTPPPTTPPPNHPLSLPLASSLPTESLPIESSLMIDSSLLLESIPIPVGIPPNEVPLRKVEDFSDVYDPPDAVGQLSVSLDEIQKIQPQSQDDYDLTFSTVSSVDTNELGDLDYSIKLSDDEEAKVVGQPKNSKVPVKVVQGHIETADEQIETTTVAEPVVEAASESDGGGCENTLIGKRAARTRKSNPRYSNEHFRLL